MLLKIQNFQPGGFQLVLVNPAVCVVRAADCPFFGKFDVFGKVNAPAKMCIRDRHYAAIKEIGNSSKSR